MTVKECYGMMGGDYEGAARLLINDATLEKFLRKSLNDKTFQELTYAVERRDVQAAFRAAHTLKGVSRNMSFKKLGDSSEILTEALRNRDEFGDDILPLYDDVKEEYTHTYECIKRFLE